MKGKFITVEGGEGGGKTTNIDYIKQWLNHHKIDYIETREPGGTPFSQKIRALLLNTQTGSTGDEKVIDSPEKIDATTELLLMFADRAQHLAVVVKPALAQGKWVLCDRFTDSTYAYQGGGRQLGSEKIATLETLVQGDLRPDFTLLLDIDPVIGMERANKRGELDRFEQEEMAFFQRVRHTYLQMAGQQPKRYGVIDASQALADVHVAIDNVLEANLRQFINAHRGVS